MITANRLSEIFEGFADTHVLVIGDVMLDNYLWGTTDRISPEAPVPVVNIQGEENRLGGAANVALNLKALGAKVTICSVTGTDSAGELLRQLLEEENIAHGKILRSDDRPTTKKSRVLSRQQQVLRYDRESTAPLNTNEETALLQLIHHCLEAEQPDLVIFQDYNKGVLTQKVISEVIAACQKLDIPTCVDPKKDNFLAYKGCTLFKPNLKEVREALHLQLDGADADSLTDAAHQLGTELNHSMTMITLSDKGIFIQDGSADGQIIPAKPRNIADVSGAGDTVVAVAGLGIAQGLDLETIAALANIAGGWVCEKPGVVPVNKEAFYSEAVSLTI